MPRFPVFTFRSLQWTGYYWLYVLQVLCLCDDIYMRHYWLYVLQVLCWCDDIYMRQACKMTVSWVHTYHQYFHSSVSMLHLKSTMIFPNEVFNSVNRCGFGCAIHSYISKSTMIFPNEVFSSESNTRVLSFAHWPFPWIAVALVVQFILI